MHAEISKQTRQELLTVLHERYAHASKCGGVPRSFF